MCDINCCNRCLLFVNSEKIQVKIKNQIPIIEETFECPFMQQAHDIEKFIETNYRAKIVFAEHPICIVALLHQKQTMRDV